MTMWAAFTSTLAVIHVVGSFRHPTSRYPNAEIIELSINPNGLKILIQYIHDLFERIHGSRAKFSDPGLYANSIFYLGTGLFYLGCNCNSWMAKALNAAGFKVDISAAALAENLMLQIRQIDRAP